MESQGLHRPIAVFDAGIGSYAIVAEIQRRLPHQDVLYFADRASFPYGTKTPETLARIMTQTLRLLETFEPSAIVMASNAPSITVLEEVRPMTRVPIFGVFPPLQEALASSTSHTVGIMGVESLIESEMLRAFVARHDLKGAHVERINASSMVELVESGRFLFDLQETQQRVNDFTAALFQRAPDIDVLTLSSTHLPWLKAFFERARPQCRFLDPAESVVAGLGNGTPGHGRIRTLVTEDARYSVSDFRRMLDRLGVALTLEVVEAPSP
ncbi:glutamate racemase [Kushneria avicenniae]|uniref:Glutamate racemase n=2 Tax=Kushneria avicenniae TaxID=402385 RepID=A0A1I1N2N9_9GAMM|nr:glutamate racemase [Kushneria avicenniae]